MPASIGEIFDQLFGGGGAVGDTSAELWGQIRSWTARFGRSALQKWSRQIARAERCQTVSVRGRKCRHVAVTECVACGMLVCLGHAYVSSDAVAVCQVCVEDVAGFQEEEEDETEEPRAARNDGRPPEVVRALKVLELGSEASWEDVTRAFRKMSAKHHPDKFTDPARKRQAEARFKKLSAAYHELEKFFRKAA